MADTLLTRSDLLIYIPSLSSVPTATLDVYLDAASRTVERLCDREFLSATVTERHPFPEHPSLWLRRPPVTAVTSLKLFYSTTPILMNSSSVVTGSSDERTDYTEVSIEAPIGYTIRSSQNHSKLFIEHGSTWTWSPDKASTWFYEVVYTGGFATAPDMVRVAVAKVVEQIHSDFYGSDRIQSERIGDYAYSKFAGGPSGQLTGFLGAMLNPYIWRAV